MRTNKGHTFTNKTRRWKRPNQVVWFLSWSIIFTAALFLVYYFSPQSLEKEILARIRLHDSRYLTPQKFYFLNQQAVFYFDVTLIFYPLAASILFVHKKISTQTGYFKLIFIPP